MKFLACLCVLIGSSFVGSAQAATTPGQTSAVPVNLNTSLQGLKQYHDSGRYMRDIARKDAEAERFIEAHLTGKKLAIVLDIDETSLSNWDEMLVNDFAYFPNAACAIVGGEPTAPCGAIAWDWSEKASAIPPTLALFKFARAHNIRVFFITGRHKAEQVVTEENLIKAGYIGWNHKDLLMEPDDQTFHYAEKFKSAKRKWIETVLGYTIVANVGDQRSDLEGHYAEGDFKLPNPYYFIP